MYNSSNSFHEAETSITWNATPATAGEQDAAVAHAPCSGPTAVRLLPGRRHYFFHSDMRHLLLVALPALPIPALPERQKDIQVLTIPTALIFSGEISFKCLYKPSKTMMRRKG